MKSVFEDGCFMVETSTGLTSLARVHVSPELTEIVCRRLSSETFSSDEEYEKHWKRVALEVLLEECSD